MISTELSESTLISYVFKAMIENKSVLKLDFKFDVKLNAQINNNKVLKIDLFLDYFLVLIVFPIDLSNKQSKYI